MNNVIFAIRQILSKNPNYFYKIVENNDGTYRMEYHNIMFKNDNTSYVGSLIIPRCKLSFNLNVEFTEPIIETIYPSQDDKCDYFKIYILDER